MISVSIQNFGGFMADNDVQADGYYGSDDMESKEIDLSFLDDEANDTEEDEE